MLLKSEDYPEFVYVFASKIHPLAIHNLEITGVYTSALLETIGIRTELAEIYVLGKVNVAELVENNGCALSPYCDSAINGDPYHFSLEKDAECVRFSRFPFHPSRLSATYAFGDFESCKKASELHGWSMDEVVKFRIDLDKGMKAFTRVARVDMNIVSAARGMYIDMKSDMKAMLWGHYWNGHEGNVLFPGNAPLWEYLIEGRLVVCK